MKYREICNRLRQTTDVLDLSLDGISNTVYIQFQSLPIRVICDKNSKEVIGVECVKFCSRWVKGGYENKRAYMRNKWLNVECLRDYESARDELTRVSNLLSPLIDKRKRYLEDNKKNK